MDGQKLLLPFYLELTFFFSNSNTDAIMFVVERS